MANTLLKVTGLKVAYGGIQAVKGVTFEVFGGFRGVAFGVEVDHRLVRVEFPTPQPQGPAHACSFLTSTRLRP